MADQPLYIYSPDPGDNSSGPYYKVEQELSKFLLTSYHEDIDARLWEILSEILKLPERPPVPEIMGVLSERGIHVHAEYTQGSSVLMYFIQNELVMEATGMIPVMQNSLSLYWTWRIKIHPENYRNPDFIKKLQ